MKNFESNRSARTFTGIALAGVALSGCSEMGNTTYDSSDISSYVVSDGHIPEDVNFRTDPRTITDKEDGITNSCANLNTVTSFKSTEVLHERGDANGPWIGFEAADLPENIQESCSSDKDGIIWVAKSLVSGEFTPIDPVTAQN